MLRLVLPFIGGQLLARWFSIGLFWSAALTVFVVLSWYVVSGRVRTYPRRWLRSAFLLPALVLFGMFWQELRSPVRASGSLARSREDIGCWRARITEVVSANDRTVQRMTASAVDVVNERWLLIEEGAYARQLAGFGGVMDRMIPGRGRRHEPSRRINHVRGIILPAAMRPGLCKKMALARY